MNEELKDYKWGIFYYNPKDRRIFVPKRNQWMGWTMNFAKPCSYFIIMSIVVFAIIMGYIQ